MFRRTAGAVFFVISFLSFSFAQEGAIEQSRPLFGTIVTLQVCPAVFEGKDVPALMGQAWGRLEDIHRKMNVFSSDSEISLVNRSGGKSVFAEEDLYGLLRYAQEYFHLTRGGFDVAAAPLFDLWRSSLRQGNDPKEEDILIARGLAGVDRIKLLRGQEILLPQGMKIDLGGIVPGFAADEVVAFFRQSGMKDFLVDVGGEIYASGKSCDGEPWQIATAGHGESGRSPEVFFIEDAAVSTSGLKEGDSGIIDPRSGRPAQDAVSVTVFAPTAMAADVLSTSLCVLGPREGMDLVASLGPGHEVLMFWRGEGGILQRYVSYGYENLRKKE